MLLETGVVVQEVVRVMERFEGVVMVGMGPNEVEVGAATRMIVMVGAEVPEVVAVDHGV